MEVTRVCLDTSAYSNFRRGDRQVTQHLDRADWIGVPSVVIGELWAGFLQGNRFDKNVAELDEFLDHPVVAVVPVNAEVAYIYGEIVVELRRDGRPLPTNDIWIAASAAQAGGAVVTFDEHFREIGRVGAIVLSPAAR